MIIACSLTRQTIRTFFSAFLIVPGVLSAQDAPATAPAQESPDLKSDKAVILPVTDTITDITYDSLVRRVDRAKSEGMDTIVLLLDTPGGSVGSCLKICTYLKDLRDDGMRVVSWVNKDAFSAGAIIALASDEIIMAPNATMGASQMIMMTQSGPQSIDESIEAKAYSPFLVEIDDSARRNGYEYEVLLTLVRPEMSLYWLENADTGERRLATPEMRNELFGYERYATPSSPSTQPAGESPEQWMDPSLSKTAWTYVQSDPQLGKISQPVLDETMLLTMRTDYALAWGFCEAEIEDESELASYLGVEGEIPAYGSTTMEQLIDWLASPLVRSGLFLLMMLGAYIEFQTPGFGVGGIVALVATVLFLGPPYAAGYAVPWEIILMVVGLALVAVEVFVIPGFGVAGIAGFICIVVGTIATFVPEETPVPNWDRFSLPSFQVTYDYILYGLYSTAGGLVGSLVGMFLLAKYMPYLPIGRQIIVANPTLEQVHMDDAYENVAVMGDIGKAESPLRPAGKARFGATLVDVVSEGEYIDKGTKVEVIRRTNTHVVVRTVA